MIEAIQDRKAWNSLLSQFEIFDYYHTFDYHQIAKEEGEEAVLLKYADENCLIALPLLIRKIPNSSYFDATSVYGYSGPLVKLKSGQLNLTLFKQALDSYFLDRKIISVFSRLHPFISHQEDCLRNLGEIQVKGNIVNIDLTLSLEEQRIQYRKRYKTYINKCRRLYTVRKGSSKAEIEAFIDLYLKTMTRVGAKPHYFFENCYFFSLMESKEFETELLMAIDNESGSIISGALFITTHGIVQYHLSGSLESYSNLHPIKLLIDEMRIRATRKGNKFFNLGGGLGTQEDTLFDFKSGFSHDFRVFKVWKYIVDQKAYDLLVSKMSEDDKGEDPEEYGSFFPSYRFLK